SYLTDSGTVIRNVLDPDMAFPFFGGNTGRLEEVDWEGNIQWSFEYSTDKALSHHDLALLPNGNILIIALEVKSAPECLAIGRKPGFTPTSGLWADMILEVKPTKPRGGEIVWEWHYWDHLIQDYNAELPNYGNPAGHPELIDINASAEKVEAMNPDTLALKKRTGKSNHYATIDNQFSDLCHTNAVYYNESLDQIAISIYKLGEIFILDHSTTPSEARSHHGGKYGKGGDILYRWGNPQNYHMGDSTDRKLFHQHDIRWIASGDPGAGHLLVYNNDLPMGPDSLHYSSIYELEPPVDAQGNYHKAINQPYGPESPIWTYTADDTISFYSSFISGAHRLQNGNTFITAGAAGRMFEVTPTGKIVWEYWTPHRGTISNTNGNQRSGGSHPYLVFRATMISADHPGIKGKTMTALDPQPDIFQVPKKQESTD
ncbi:MAG: aryl-sulfate sulfotransferase, partial [Saprospiraceae bacterium]|nr:aryl-sulfate sulfotransferase [Saprospiraceae bacterium]